MALMGSGWLMFFEAPVTIPKTGESVLYKIPSNRILYKFKEKRILYTIKGNRFLYRMK